jgi:hypothetical protein
MLMLMVSLNSSGIEATFTIAPNGTALATNLINGPLRLYSFELVSGGNASVTWRVVDSPATNTTRGPAQGFFLDRYSNGVYYTYGQSNYTFTKTVTNYAGAGTNSAAGVLGGTWATNQTYSGIYTYTTTNAATTNFFRSPFAGTTGTTPGGITTVPIDNAYYFSKGLTYTNGLLGTSIVVNVIYEPAF